MNSALAFLITLLIPTYLVRFSVGLPTTVYECFVWIGLLYLLLKDWKKTVTKFHEIDKWLLVGLVLVVFGALLSLVNHPDLISGLGLVKGFILTPLAAGAVILLLGPSYYNLSKLGLITSGLLVGGEAVIEFYLKAGLVDGRAIGLFRLDAGASPNYLALYLAPIAVMAIVGLSESKLKIERVFISISILVMLVALIASQSRAGVGVVVITSILFFWSKLKSHPRFGKIYNSIGLLVIFIFLVFTIIMAMPRLTAGPTEGRVSSSNNIRYEIWKTTTLEIIPSHWLLGTGLGNYQSVFADITNGRVNFNEYITPRALTPHNLLLSTWVNIGLVGLAGLLTILFLSYQKRQYDSWSFMLLAIVLLGVFDTTVFKNDLGAQFWIAVAIVTAKTKGDKNR